MLSAVLDDTATRDLHRAPNLIVAPHREDMPLSSFPSSFSGSSSPQRVPLLASSHQFLVPVHISTGEDESDNEVERSRLRLRADMPEEENNDAASVLMHKRRRDDIPLLADGAAIEEHEDMTGYDASEEDEARKINDDEWADNSRAAKRARILDEEEDHQGVNEGEDIHNHGE